MPAFMRCLLGAALLLTAAAVHAESNTGSFDLMHGEARWIVRGKLSFSLLDGTGPLAGTGTTERLLWPVARAPLDGLALRHQRLRVQVRDVVVPGDRLEFARVHDAPVLARLVANTGNFWDGASQTRGSTARLRLSYQSGPWGVSIGATPALKEGGYQARLTYALRF